MEKIAFKSRTTQAKVLGSITSISGAFIVTFYKGPSIFIAHDSPSLHLPYSNGTLTSVDTNWVVGGLLLTVSNILLTIWYIYQVCMYMYVRVHMRVYLLLNMEIGNTQ